MFARSAQIRLNTLSRNGSRETSGLVIGIDSVPLDLMLPWAANGHLPSFAKSPRLDPTGDLIPGSRYPSRLVLIYTGKNPGKHGIIGFRNHKPNTYEEVSVNSTLRDARDVWGSLEPTGRRSSSSTRL